MIMGNSKAIRLLNYSKESPTHILKGPKGLGKATIAKALSKSYLCSNQKRNCSCTSCKKFNSGNHPDYIYIGMTDKTIKVEDIMPVIHGVLTQPLESEYKVFLIDDANYMTIEAQNKLLKTVEDVPDYIKIVIVAHGLLLPTIESRCIVHNFYSLSTAEMEEFAKSIGLSGVKKEMLLGMANGSPGTLMHLRDALIMDYFVKTVQLIINKVDVSEALSANGLLKEKDKLNIANVLGEDIVNYLFGIYTLLNDILNISLGDNPHIYKSIADDLKKVNYNIKTIVEAMDFLNPILLYSNNPYKEVTDAKIIQLFDILFN